MPWPKGEKRSEETTRKMREAAKRNWAEEGYREKMHQKMISQETREKFNKTIEKKCGPAGRFWSKVDIKGFDECWEWRAVKVNKGYGQYFLFGRKRPAHVAAFILSGGILTADKPYVLHKCDNPPCCNPAHLFAGNHDENMRDKVNKGRQSYGEISKNAKLTEKEVLEIRNLKGELSQRKIAKLYGVGKTTITSIHRGISWQKI